VNAEPPPGPSGANAPFARRRILRVCLASGGDFYGVGYLIWYLGTPLGRAPQLDGAENIALAEKIAAGTLPHEMFYRAMLYPAALAVPLKLGLPAEDMPTLAAIFRISATLRSRSQWRVWRRGFGWGLLREPPR